MLGCSLEYTFQTNAYHRTKYNQTQQRGRMIRDLKTVKPNIKAKLLILTARLQA